MHQNPTLDSLVDILVLCLKMILDISGVLPSKDSLAGFTFSRLSKSFLPGVEIVFHNIKLFMD